MYYIFSLPPPPPPHHTHTHMFMSVVLKNSKPIVVSDNDHDLHIVWWIKDRFLTEGDRQVLLSGNKVIDNIVSAAQMLLSEQYPNLKVFQNTCFGQHLDFKLISWCIRSVQILHRFVDYCSIRSSSAWGTWKYKFYDLQRALSIGCVCRAVAIKVMDSLGSFMTLNWATVQQICKIWVMTPFPKMSQSREFLSHHTDRSLNIKVYCMCKLQEDLHDQVWWL